VPADSAAAQPRDRAPARRLADGTIDLVCSDHAPVDDDGKRSRLAKRSPARRASAPLPLTLKWAAEDKFRSRWGSRAYVPPAEILGSPAGHLGWARRPISVCSTPRRVAVEPSALVSQGKNTPFLGSRSRAGSG
jgi:dihydroorotase